MSEHPVRRRYDRYFENREASGYRTRCDEATATHMTLAIRHGAGYCTEMLFEWPAQKYQSEQCERMLALAYDYGDDRARKQIRDVLGIR